MKKHKRWRKILKAEGFKKEKYLGIAICYWNEEWEYRIIVGSVYRITHNQNEKMQNQIKQYRRNLVWRKMLKEER